MRKNIIITVLLLIALTTNAAYASVLGIPIEGGFFMNIGGESYLYQNLYRSEEENIGQQTEHFIEYVPNNDMVPVVSSGGKLFGKRTILEAYDYMRSNGLMPVAGINADFFSFKTGVPMSNTIINGELVTKESQEQCGIGFYDDGTAFIGWMDFQTTLITENQTIDIYNVNKYRQPYTIYLMNDEFSDTTENDTPGLDVILGEISGPLKIGGEITAVVESISHNEGAIPIPKGKMVLTIDDAAFPDLYEQVSQLRAGEKVTIKSEALYDERWNNVSHGIGCIGGRLVENGRISGGFEAGTAPRTAVGIKADGEIVFYTIDGRQQGYSYGVSLETLAQRMIELGCVDAVNLDGGGSTVIAGIYPGSDTLSVINSPSDGSLRKSANYIFLQKKSQEPIVTQEPAVSTPNPQITQTPAASLNPNDTSIKIDISENAAPTAAAETAEPDESSEPVEIKPEYPEIDAEYADNLITVNVKTDAPMVGMQIFIDGIDHTAYAEISDSGRIAVYKTDAEFDKYIHRIKITAETSDGLANIKYITTKSEEGYKNVFMDTTSHWAIEYISYMSDKGIVQGEKQGKKIFFRPQNNMTRAEFAVMMANSMHINLSEFENTSSDFEDSDKIPDWAAKHINAMYAKGIIMGKNTETGVKFDPYAPITRAEAMTIIARTLPENLEKQEMTFDDNNDIPVWAADSISKLVCMGAVSGYTDNTILPNKKITRAEGVKLLYEVY